MTYFIRVATKHDQAGVQAVVGGVLAEYGLSLDPTATDADLMDLDASYQNAGGHFAVLVDEHDAVVGTVGIRRIDAAACELRKMYLAKSMRGQGWGKRLLEHILAQAARMHFTRVTLETATVLTEAIAMYERCGFRRYVPEHLAKRCDLAYCLDIAPASLAEPTLGTATS